ncbi:MAG: homocysteine S-methyltransferase family protein [Pseudomonadota bacterium]
MKPIVLLDGGMGMELLHRSDNKTPTNWSAQYLMDEPDLVKQVHGEYIDAGASVITINAYSATFTRLSRVNNEDRVPELQRLACELAIASRDAAGDAGADVKIAGCLPPLNGSYRPDRVMPYDQILDEYQRLVEFQAPYVDVIICETMSSAIEAKATATAAAASGKPVWVGVTLAENASNKLRSGESIADVMSALESVEVNAIVANCAPPESVRAAMPDLVATGLPTGGYANAFTPIPVDYMPGQTLYQLGARRDLDGASYAAFAMDWIDNGAEIVGGCCEVGVDHIRHLHESIVASGRDIVGLPAAA